MVTPDRIYDGDTLNPNPKAQRAGAKPRASNLLDPSLFAFWRSRSITRTRIRFRFKNYATRYKAKKTCTHQANLLTIQ